MALPSDWVWIVSPAATRYFGHQDRFASRHARDPTSPSKETIRARAQVRPVNSVSANQLFRDAHPGPSTMAAAA
jgi:hypothetical protein